MSGSYLVLTVKYNKDGMMKIKTEITPLNSKATNAEFVLRDALAKAERGEIVNVVITAEFKDGDTRIVSTIRSTMTELQACFMHRIAGWNLDNFMKDQ